MKSKAALDTIEALVGIDRPTGAEIEKALRALVAVADPESSIVDDVGTIYETAESVVDRADVADRSTERTSLYQRAKALLKAAFEGEAREALVDVKGQNIGCRGGWGCSRKARSSLVMPNGEASAACFQHERDLISRYAGQKLSSVFPPDDPEDDGDGFILAYGEHHESSSPRLRRGDETTPVTVGVLWKRLFVRTERVLAAIPDGPEKEALATSMAAFADRWGEWA